MRIRYDDRRYYVNHITKETQWVSVDVEWVHVQINIMEYVKYIY